MVVDFGMSAIESAQALGVVRDFVATRFSVHRGLEIRRWCLPTQVEDEVRSVGR
jgi:hypothetical protein